MSDLPRSVPLLSVGVARCAICWQVTRPGQGYDLRELILNELVVYAAVHHPGECEVRDVHDLERWQPKGMPA